MKTLDMESGKLPCHSYLETAAILENLGGCCEGTVFTFTSADSRWRLRQRLNRNKASLVSAHGGLLLREDPADSVFTEMRIMPRSSEPNPSNGVELWNRNKSLNSVRTKESSRANYEVNSGAADLRDHCCVKKLTRQVGGDSRGKILSQEAVKADDERRELQVSIEEITPRKSRRYLRYENSREKHRYVDVVEEDKIWTWNENKLEEVRAQGPSKEHGICKGNKPAEERRNKRVPSAEEIHVFEQRKVKCRRREQDSCSTQHSESVRSEDLSKADDFKQASYGFNHRQIVPEEPRKQQAGPVVAICSSVADDSTKNRRGPSIDSAEEMEDRRLNNIAKQNSVFELHIKRGNVTEQNRSWMAARPSAPPKACSFISFKGGVSCVGNRRCHFLGNASSRARAFPNAEHTATAVETQSHILNDSRPVQERSRRGLSTSSNRNQSNSELAFPRKITEMEGGDAQLKTDRKQMPEALENFKFKGLEKEGVMLSETEADNSPHTVGPAVSFYQRPMSTRATEGSFDREADAFSVWETSHSGISKSRHTSVSEEESGPRRIDVSQPDSPTAKKGPRGRLSSNLLDCHGSLQVEDALKTTDLDGNDLRSNERESDESIAKGEADGRSAQGRVESCDDILEGSPEGMNNLPLAEVNCCEPFGVPNKSVNDGNADLEEKLRCKIARNYLRKFTTLELENQSLKEPDTSSPDGTQSIETSCTSMPEIVGVDRLPQKSVPVRRHAWVKGFKKKTGEKVSYFESWLGRSKKLQKTSPGRKCGFKGVAELSQANPIADKRDQSRLSGHSIDQHLISPAWSKKDSLAYVTKEFEILEAVLQSELNVDYEQAEEADHLQNASMKSSSRICIVDNGEGRWEERGTMTEQSNFRELDAVNMKTVATNLETEDNLAQSSCTAGDGLPFECGEHPEVENSQQRHRAKTPGSWNDVSTPNSFGEEESSHMVNVSNNTAGLAKECRKKEEGRDPLALPKKNSARESLNVTSERHLLQPKDILECGVMSQRGTKTSRLERSRDKDVGMFPQTNDTPCCVHAAQNTGLAGQCGNSLEKDKRNQSNKATAEHNKIAEGVKLVPHLTVFNDRRDISTNKVLNSSDFSVQQLRMADRFGGLATQISLLEDHTIMSRIESINSDPSDLISGSGSLSDAVDSPLQNQILQRNPFNRASSAVSQQVPSPVQESSVPEMVEHGKQFKSSSVKLLQGARNVVDVDSNFSLKSVARKDISQSTCGRRAEIAHNTTNLEYSSANSKLEIDFDHFPSSIKAPTEIKIPGAERKKESPVNRRHKMPIIVRVRNRLASGWLLQHPLWKRVAKHKMKIGESQALATKVTNHNEVHADPSSLNSGQGSTRDPLVPLNESRTEDGVKMNLRSNHDTELTGTSVPQNLILEAHHQTSATTENENLCHGPLRDLDTCKCHPIIEGMESKPASDNYAIAQQNRVNKKHAPPSNHDEAEEEQTNDCPIQASSVLTFAEWQSLTKGNGKFSMSRKRVGAKSDSAVKESEKEREMTELGISNELSDVGELLSVVCLGNIVKEATVLGAFTDFDARCDVPTVFGEGEVERDYGRFNQASVDVCGAAMAAASRCKREKVSAVSQTSTDCSADEHILNSNSDTATSSYCQTEPVATAEFLEKTEEHIPVDSPADHSPNKKIPSVEDGAESEWSRECKSLQKCFSLNDQNEVLQTCSSASSEHAFERAPYISGRTQMQRLTGDSIGEQPQLDGQSDDMCSTPQVEDFLGYLLIERTVGQATPVTPFQRRLCPGTADNEYHNKNLSKSFEPFGHAKVVAPFCPPLQSANSDGKEMARGGGTVKERAMEDPRMSSSPVKGWQEGPAMSCHSAGDKSSGDFKPWEIMEMLKPPNNQPQLLSGQRPEEFSRKETQEQVYRTGKQTNTWESCRRDFGGSHRTRCWKDAPALQSPNDRSTEDLIFLERFSATSKNVNPCEISEGGFAACSYIGIRPSGQSCTSSSDLTTKMRLSSAPGRFGCGKIGSDPSDRSVELASLPSDVQLINSRPSVFTRSSLGEAERPQSNQEDKYGRYNTFEPKLLPDYTASFDCPSPCFSVSRSLDNSERRFSWARPCTDCLSKYEHQDTCVQCDVSMHAWKHSSAPVCLPSRLTHNPSIPAQCQSLLLNPRPNSNLSSASRPSSQYQCDAHYLSCRFSPPVLPSCHHPSYINPVQDHRYCHFPGRCPLVPISSDQPGKFQNTSTPSLNGISVQCPKKDTLPPYIPLQVIQPSGTGRPLSRHSQETFLTHERHQFAEKDRVRQDDQIGGQPQSSRTKATDRDQGLVWLSPEEMNLIEQVRLSGEKTAHEARPKEMTVLMRRRK